MLYVEGLTKALNAELERTVSRRRADIRKDASCPRQSDYLVQEELPATAGDSRPCIVVSLENKTRQ